MIRRFMGAQTMCHKLSLWLEKPLPDADRAIFGNSGGLSAKSAGIFPDEGHFWRRSARFWSAGDRGTAMEQKNDGDDDHPRRPLRSFCRRCGRDGRWCHGWAASAGGAIRVTVAAAGAERVPGREQFLRLSIGCGPVEAGAEKIGGEFGKMAGFMCLFQVAGWRLGRQRTIVAAKQGIGTIDRLG